ncbi:MAG: ATP-grasp domain-containing protein, partial [Pirellulales bacterium]
MMPTVIVLGASVRAACASARRAGVRTYAADLFADCDTRRLAVRTIRVRPWPAGCIEAMTQFPHVPWMYTGALENHPQLLRQLAELRPLLGNPHDVVRQVRDPLQVAAALRAAGLPSADARRTPVQKHHDRWLRKPLQGAGGLGIDRADEVGCEIDGRHYWQRHVFGRAASAVFVAADGRADLLGTTYQIVGDAAFGASGFRYAGNLAPGPSEPAILEQIRAIGETLAAAFQLRGLFGVDGVVTERDFVPVEVNPRFTASVDVLEMLRPESLVARHLAACQPELPPPKVGPKAEHPVPAAGKAILFAPHRFVVDDALARQLARQSNGSRYADLPRLGERIKQGHPIATALAVDESTTLVEQRLKQMACAV